MKAIEYTTSGTCSQKILLVANDQQIVTDLQVIGGCNGNLKGISSLVKGMSLQNIIERLSGITCGMKGTSCPDQISCAAKKLKEQY